MMPLSPGLQRIQARQSEVVLRAVKLRAVLGDPILGLARVLRGVPVVEDDVWDRIIQEPYGRHSEYTYSVTSANTESKE